MKYAAKQFKKFVISQEFFRYLLIDRILEKKDNVVLITGRRGSGKTTLALKLIMGFQNMESNLEFYNEEKNIHLEDSKKVKYKLKNFTPFEMRKHIVFDKEELQVLWKNERNGFVLGDEAIVALNRRNAMSRSNKLLNEILTINRKNHNTIFLCLPSIEDVDSAFLQHITHWLCVDQRGLAAVMLPNVSGSMGRQSWNVPKMTRLHEKFMDDNPNAPSPPYWIFENFCGYIKFSALSDKVENKYLEIAHEKKNKDSDEAEQKLSRPKRESISTESKQRIKEIVDDLLNGELSEKSDYYNYAESLNLNKPKFNKEVNEELFKRKEYRTVTEILKSSKSETKESTEESDWEVK